MLKIYAKMHNLASTSNIWTLASTLALDLANHLSNISSINKFTSANISFKDVWLNCVACLIDDKNHRWFNILLYRKSQ